MATGRVLQFDQGRGYGFVAFAVRLADHDPALAGRPSPSAQPLTPPEDEQMCDVLSRAEFSQEITEILLHTAPALTGQQILEVRQGVLDFARKRGWVNV